MFFRMLKIYIVFGIEIWLILWLIGIIFVFIFMFDWIFFCEFYCNWGYLCLLGGYFILSLKIYFLYFIIFCYFDFMFG